MSGSVAAAGACPAPADRTPKSAVVTGRTVQIELRFMSRLPSSGRRDHPKNGDRTNKRAHSLLLKNRWVGHRQSAACCEAEIVSVHHGSLDLAAAPSCMGKRPRAREAAEVMLRRLGDDSEFRRIGLNCVASSHGALPSNESEDAALVLLP